MVKTKNSILIDYQNKAEHQQQYISKLKRDLNKISFSRLGLFVVEILIVALMVNIGYSIFVGIALVIPVVCFLFLVKKQIRVQEKITYASQLLWVYENEARILQGNENGYNNGAQYQDEQHSYSSDLDIFGEASLFAYLNRCNTRKGMDLLCHQLSYGSNIYSILHRQEAISEMMSHMDQTQHFRAQLQNHDPEQLQVIEYKLEHQLPQQLKFTRNAFLRIYTKAVPYLTIAVLLAGILIGGILWKILMLLALFHASLTFFFMKEINKVYYGFSGSSNLLNSFAGTIRWTEEIAWKSTYIKNLFNGSTETNSVSRQIRELSGIIRAFDARLNIILSAALNLLFLWDLQCVLKLQKWHSRSSDQLQKALYRISQFEELISQATLKYNEPEWNFPDLTESFCLQAKDLGHPLIKEEGRIANDFSLQSRSTVDIITGSNMAGKSTFLRTVGINMILAYAGAPVCAKHMSLSIFKVLSYMRIKDSLNDHTSTFKAELNRLKMILDAVNSSSDSFVLIDEMLRGTNSKDKYQGSRVFIEHMINKQTPALFATHDLQLSEMQQDYPQQVRNYHFDIQIADGEMKFDYKLKEGPCKTFNAALLLKEIGLTLN